MSSTSENTGQPGQCINLQLLHLQKVYRYRFHWPSRSIWRNFSVVYQLSGTIWRLLVNSVAFSGPKFLWPVQKHRFPLFWPKLFWTKLIFFLIPPPQKKKNLFCLYKLRIASGFRISIFSSNSLFWSVYSCHHLRCPQTRGIPNQWKLAVLKMVSFHWFGISCKNTSSLGAPLESV